MIYIETEKVELKRSLNENFEKEVVAFLNSFDGVIYIGVEDNGIICGVNKIDEIMYKISDIISNNIVPNPIELIEVILIYESGKDVFESSESDLIIKIPYNRKVLSDMNEEIKVENEVINYEGEEIKSSNEEIKCVNEVINIVGEVINNVNEIIKYIDEEILSLEEKIILFIQNFPDVTKKQLVRILDKSMSSIERVLKNSKRIIRVGSRKNGHWEVLD